MLGYAHKMYCFFKDCSRRMGKMNEKNEKYRAEKPKWLPWQKQVCEEGGERKVI